jgi:hypothetical protein
MQDPSTPTAEDDEASIPAPVHMLTGPNLNRTFTVRRKAAKRTFPWKLTEDELQLALPRPQEEDDDIRETKRPRLEDSSSASTYEITPKKTLHATAVALPPTAGTGTGTGTAADTGTGTGTADTTAGTATDFDPDPVTDMHPTAWTTGAPRGWTTEKDAQLTSAVTKARKKKYGEKFVTSWVAVAALVPGRTKRQCKNRWQDRLVSNIDPATARAGKWTADEDKTLKDGVRAHGGKNWNAIAALVLGRTREQCQNRWHHNLVTVPVIGRQLPRLSQVERKNSVAVDGMISWCWTQRRRVLANGQLMKTRT